MGDCDCDEADVRGCRDGRADRFRALVARHEAAVLALLVARLGDRDAAGEAAQEAFVRAYFALPRLREPAAFGSWVLGIAARVAQEAARARRRSPRTGDPGLDRAAARPEGDQEADPALARAVAGLPEAQREVIRLRFAEGRSCAAIARDLGVPVGTVTSRLARAYALLRTALAGRD